MTVGLETFAKVRALHDRATNPGEKAAAAGRMEALARSAGMTVAEAVSKLDAPEPEIVASTTVDMGDAFNAFFNSPKMRAERAAHEIERQKRRAGILSRYGSAEAVFAETEIETALRVACESLTEWDRRPDYEGCYTLGGWDWTDGREKVPPRVRVTVSAAWPLPQTVNAAWAEYLASEAREDERHAMHDYEHHPALWSQVRRHLVEDLLDTLPAASIDDMLMRQSWLEHLNERGFSRDIRRDTILLATLRADIERMGQRLREQGAEPATVQDGHDPNLDGGKASPVQSGQPEGSAHGAHPSLTPCRTSAEFSAEAPHVQSGHPRRTNADKRRDVLALFGQNLTDREIARRAGVSPQTVGNIRRQTT